MTTIWRRLLYWLSSPPIALGAAVVFSLLVWVLVFYAVWRVGNSVN